MPSRVRADPFVPLLRKAGRRMPIVHELLVLSATHARDTGITRRDWLKSLRGNVDGIVFSQAFHVAPIVWSRFLDEDDEEETSVEETS